MPMDGYGSISWWGFSPSLNLLDYLSECPHDDDSGKRDVNILVVNNHDPRNILHTLCHYCEEIKQDISLRNANINFYVVESSVEQVGRYMILLTAFLDESFGLQEKVETFLEIYGNSLLRNPTAEYVSQKSRDYIKAITDLQYCAERYPIFDLSLLKHKERDYLEATVKFWTNPDIRNFEIHKMWDFRNREYLGPRYDVKENAYDWDRIMKLQDRGAAIIQKGEYEAFRSKGIAFESRSGDYNVPNRTLSSPIVIPDAKADLVMKRGYFGDVVTGPFIAFGVECQNEDLFKKANNVYVNASLDVSAYNLQQLLQKLSMHKKVADAEDEDEDLSESGYFVHRYLKNVSIKFVYGKDLKYFLIKEKFHDFFHLVHMASDSAHFLDESLSPILQPKCNILVENPKYIVDLKKDQIGSILHALKDRGEKMGLELKPDKNSDFTEKPFQMNFLHFTR